MELADQNHAQHWELIHSWERVVRVDAPGQYQRDVRDMAEDRASTLVRWLASVGTTPVAALTSAVIGATIGVVIFIAWVLVLR
ncbi:MAG: hypothetical protein U0821_20025 [Chloroflexota bacterium]